MALNRLVLILMLLVAVGCASAQPSSIPLVFGQGSGCPVLLRGAITSISKQDAAGHAFDSFEGTILATNVSGKDIVLLITRLHTIGLPGDNTEFGIYDYFFSDVFESNGTREFPTSGPPVLEGPTIQRPIGLKAKATASIIFVQFADGSTWGDAEAAKDALHQRQAAWDKLKALANTLRSRGERQFVAELTQPVEPGSPGEVYVGSVRRAYANGDPSSAIEELNDKLDAADLHWRSMQATGVAEATK